MSGSVDGRRVLVCSRANTGIMNDGREVNRLPSTSGGTRFDVPQRKECNNRYCTHAVCHRSVKKTALGPKGQAIITSPFIVPTLLTAYIPLSLFIALPPPPRPPLPLPALTKPWITTPLPSGTFPAPLLVSINCPTTTFSPSSRSSSTIRILRLPALIQYLMMASTPPRSLIYRHLPHLHRLATTVAPALPVPQTMCPLLVDSQQTAPPSRMLTNLSAKQVLMPWRRKAQVKSPVCAVPYSAHAPIEALLSAKKSPARRKSGTSQVSANSNFQHLMWSLTIIFIQDESRLMKRKEQNRAAQRAFRERKEKHVKDVSFNLQPEKFDWVLNHFAARG